MKFKEEDIDFEKINWKQFEELSFDLIAMFSFHSLKWRQGGADDGRDIEACRTIYNAMVNQFEEKWFFECKKYTSGVAVADIHEKLAWARAEKANHFVIITNSYLTKACREFIEKTRNSESFKIHTIEGKHLKKLIIKFPEIVRKYFIDRYSQLVKNSFQVWLYHDFLPDEKTVVDICRKIELERLSYQEIAFLWFVLHEKEYELEEYCKREELELIDIDFVIPYLKKNVNHDYPVLSKNDAENHGILNTYGLAWSRSEGADRFYASCHYEINRKEYLQVCFIRNEQSLDLRIGYQKEEN